MFNFAIANVVASQKIFEEVIAKCTHTIELISERNKKILEIRDTLQMQFKDRLLEVSQSLNSETVTEIWTACKVSEEHSYNNRTMNHYECCMKLCVVFILVK